MMIRKSYINNVKGGLFIDRITLIKRDDMNALMIYYPSIGILETNLLNENTIFRTVKSDLIKEMI